MERTSIGMNGQGRYDTIWDGAVGTCWFVVLGVVGSGSGQFVGRLLDVRLN